MSIFRNLNLKHDEVLGHIEKVISEQKALYMGVRVRCVSVKEEQIWKNAICVIQVLPKYIDMPIASTSLRYPRVHLLEKFIELNELIPFLKQGIEKKLVIDEEDIFLNQPLQFTNWYFESGGNDYSKLAGYRCEYSSGSLNMTNEPILAYGLPFFSDLSQAVKHWSGLKQFQSHDARSGAVIVFIPECRAGFDNYNVESNKLTIFGRTSNNDLMKNLKLKGAWMIKDISQEIEVPFDKEIFLTIPEGAEKVELYLLGSDDTVYDFHEESKFWVHGLHRILGTYTSDSDSATIEKALSSGECETVEFKPFIQIGNEKWSEVIETVIAFANTKGGIIIFGVNKHCSVEGIDRGIFKIAKEKNITSDDALEIFKGEIRTKVGDSLNHGVILDIKDISYKGQQLVVVNVPEGQDKPYAHFHKKDIFIRRSSNNVKPDPDTELPQLFKARTGFFENQ